MGIMFFRNLQGIGGESVFSVAFSKAFIIDLKYGTERLQVHGILRERSLEKAPVSQERMVCSCNRKPNKGGAPGAQSFSILGDDTSLVQIRFLKK